MATKKWQDYGELAEAPADGDTVLIRDVSDTTDDEDGTVKEVSRQNLVQTASELLTAIKTVDGAASGLDADLLDGSEATAFYSVGGTDVPITDGGTGASTAAGARSNLDVDQAGTDNSTDVTLAGTPDYLTIVGQVITRALINLASHVTGLLPVANGGTGASTAAGARSNLDVDQAGTDNSTDVTLAGVPDYITISGQEITRNAVDLAADVTGDLPVTEGGTGASDASGARTNLGLAIGSDVLAFDAAGLVESLSGMIETAQDKIYVLDRKAAYPYTINELAIRCSSGTCTAKMTIDGVDVTGITGISVSSAEASGTGTAANVVSAANTVAIVISANSAAINVAFTVKKTRNAP